MPNNPVTDRPMAPISSVFGGERNTPHEIFSRAHVNPETSGPANHRQTDLALACPSCRAEGNPGARLYAKPDVGYYCMSGRHKWKDFDELMVLNPDKLEYRGIKARQDGFAKIEVEVPGAVASAFMAKFGERGAATVAALMNVLSTSRSMVLSEDDLKKIEERIGETVTNGSAIAGKVFAQNERIKELEGTIERLRGNMQATAGGRRLADSAVVVDLGEELAQKLHETVASKDWTAEMYVTEAVRLAIEGGWV